MSTKLFERRIEFGNLDEIQYGQYGRHDPNDVMTQEESDEFDRVRRANRRQFPVSANGNIDLDPLDFE